MTECYLGVGSNLGERRKNIRLAVGKIDRLKGTRVLKSSRVIETEAVGGPRGQGRFLNVCLKIRTALPAALLLKRLQAIERELGRKKTVKNGPRTIDLDILFYGDRIIHTRGLIVPHPRVFEREFVLRPLLELV